jgi:hypothetical protein
LQKGKVDWLTIIAPTVKKGVACITQSICRWYTEVSCLQGGIGQKQAASVSHAIRRPPGLLQPDSF